MDSSHLDAVVETTLENGFRLLALPDRTAPIVSVWTWYRVGSRNEMPGATGLSHWVEHMQFKGTPTLGKGQIFRDVSRHGGVLNAMTSTDWTAYYETLPAAQLPLAIAIEADRMRNSLFDPGETESERTVILSERLGAENRPTYRLYEELIGAAFRAHPYGHSVIGFEHDLRSLDRDALYTHYQTYYQPANAYMVVVGDFDSAELINEVEKGFGSYASGEQSAPVGIVEPDQSGERRVSVVRPAPTAHLQIGYHAPPARHPDVAALLVVDAILSGGKGLGYGGSNGVGRSSRMYRALVSSGIARGASSDFGLTLDPYLFSIGVAALPASDRGVIESTVDELIDQMRRDEPGEQELERAKKQMRAQVTYASEGVTNQAFRLGHLEIVDSYRRSASLLDEVSAVSPADVRRAADTYLKPEHRTVGWLIPATDGGSAESAESPDRAFISLEAPRYWAYQTSAPTEPNSYRFERRTLPNEMTLLGQVRQSSPSVTMRVRLLGGAVTDSPLESGLASFTARSLLRGTERRTFAEINERTDAIGASLGVDASRHFTELSIRCLAEDLPAMVALAAEVLRAPSFPADEVERVRQLIESGIKEADNDTGSRATRAFRQLIFPTSHPYRRRVAGELETVAHLNRDELARHHATMIGPVGATVAVVGGIANIDVVAELVTAHFGDWRPIAAPVTELPLPPPPIARSEQVERLAGKSQADIVLGGQTIARRDPRYHALDTANLILGRLGLMGRLGASVRDDQGLAYHVSSSLEVGKEGSLWLSRAGVDPANIERAIAGILQEVSNLQTHLVTDQDLDDAKQYFVGVLPIALESSSGVAGTLLNIERFDLGLDYLDRYPGIIAGLTRDDVHEAIRTAIDPAVIAIGIGRPAEE